LTIQSDHPKELEKEDMQDIKKENTENLEPESEDKTENIADLVSEEGDTGESIQSLDELKEQLLRALADNENVRRRAKKEVQEASQFAITNFSRDLLSVADNMDRALSSLPADSLEENDALAAIVNGIKMTARELESILKKYKIEKINPLDEKFDYNFHQAMFETKESGKPDGIIVEVLQPGYILGERLLRPAMVGVAKSKEIDVNQSSVEGKKSQDSSGEEDKKSQDSSGEEDI